MAAPGVVRDAEDIVDAVVTWEGVRPGSSGFQVKRPFPRNQDVDQTNSPFDPFVLLDEMGPVQFAAGQARGAPDHGHRGLETVTYLLKGESEHKDSLGNRGTMRAGDVQWMTAGAGISHDEGPSEDIRTNGGTLHGVQLWVNLPKSKKWTRPRYQDIAASRIPAAQTPDGSVQVRVIAGEAMGAKAETETFYPITYLHFTLKAGASVEQAIPEDHNTFAYILEGHGLFGSNAKAASASQAVHFGPGSVVVAKAGQEGPLDFLLLAGKPLKEPVFVTWGKDNFVMNSAEELVQAQEDYACGRISKVFV